VFNRWLVLSLTAYLLAHWTYLHSGGGTLPDWGEAAQSALELLFPLMALLPLLADIQRLRPLAKSYGLDIKSDVVQDLSLILSTTVVQTAHLMLHKAFLLVIKFFFTRIVELTVFPQNI
jgi:hypothetical protein